MSSIWSERRVAKVEVLVFGWRVGEMSASWTFDQTSIAAPIPRTGCN